MVMKSRLMDHVRRTFVLDRAKSRAKRLAPLCPTMISSDAGLRRCLVDADVQSLWISYDPELTAALLRGVPWPARKLGAAILSHAVSAVTLPALGNCFKRFAYAAQGGFLSPEELAAALKAGNARDLFIGGAADAASRTLTLWRGDLEPLTVPFVAFETSGDGTVPDFERFSVVDFGQTIRLGDYEAASDAVLRDFDRGYRRRQRAPQRRSPL
jgi:hypothetical protein